MPPPPSIVKRPPIRRASGLHGPDRCHRLYSVVLPARHRACDKGATLVRNQRILRAALAACVSLVLPVTAAAAPDVIASSPTPIEAIWSSNGRFVAWQLHAGTVTVFDRQGGTSSYSFEQLRPPSVVAAYITGLFGISDDGRYLTYSLRFHSTVSPGYTTVVRLDRDTGDHLVVFDDAAQGQIVRNSVVGGNRPRVAVDAAGGRFVWIDLTAQPTLTARVMVRSATEPDAQQIGTTCLVPSGQFVRLCAAPDLSRDGTRVVYVAGENAPGALAYRHLPTGETTYYPQVAPAAPLDEFAARALVLASDSELVIAHESLPHGADVVFDPGGATRVDTLDATQVLYQPVALNRETLLLRRRGSSQRDSAIVDRRSGLLAPLPGTWVLGLSIAGEVLAVRVGTDAFELVVTKLDADGDGMLDGWESYFGLDPANPADATLDANADGITNLQAFLDRRHPTALASATRLFAEGAAGAFFDTVVTLFNPGPDEAKVVTRLQGVIPEQFVLSVQTLPAGGRADVASCCLSVATPAEFGVIVESTMPIVVERRMTWDRALGYGSHASTAVPAAETTWHFAEGATIAGFQTFFLLQNPAAVPVTVDVDYLLQTGGTVRRTHLLPSAGRYTIWANQEGAELAAAEFATRVTATAPIVAERAMYRDVQGQFFGAGSNAVGATTPSTTWSFAEGATGDFFDTFILVANTAQTAGTLTATYTAEAAGGVPVTVTRTYDLAPESRRTIWLDHEDAALASAAVSTFLSADVPVVAERSMWWPGSAATWAESHVEFGAVERGLRWAVADAELDPSTGTDTFVLVDADTGGTPATVRVVAYPSLGAPITRDVAVAAGRNTLWMAALFPEVGGQRFSVTIESLDRPGVAAPITVEKALYSRWFDAGAASLATRLPDPIP